MNHVAKALGLLALSSAFPAAAFETLKHLGANSPWFAGPNVNKISSDVPDGCEVDQAVYIVRHGSRYPDPSSYQQWVTLYQKIQSAEYKASETLSFLPDWAPVLKHPEQEIAQVSITGYKELYNLGTDLRFRYPSFYTDNAPYLLWANDYQRTIDSARLFARGYMGPNSSYGNVYAVNADTNAAVGNSLATSDECPAFKDSSGGTYATTWDDIYLPPITKRLNKLLKGNLTFTDSDVSIFPYLCGFETQITGSISPWCSVFTDEEILQYQYRQDLRYYYGTGPGSGKNMTVMLPLLQGIVNLLGKGPTATAKSTTNSTVTLPQLIVAFTHDNQINELASILGIFDQQRPLSSKQIDRDRLYISSNITPMRGTIAFERLSCSTSNPKEENARTLRILLNDAVYPLPSCRSGPGSSCPLDQYAKYVAAKRNEYGSFASICGLPEGNVTTAAEDGAVTFFTDLAMPFLRVVKP